MLNVNYTLKSCINSNQECCMNFRNKRHAQAPLIINCHLKHTEADLILKKY